MPTTRRFESFTPARAAWSATDKSTRGWTTTSDGALVDEEAMTEVGGFRRNEDKRCAVYVQWDLDSYQRSTTVQEKVGCVEGGNQPNA
jgi:hypothetical protein